MKQFNFWGGGRNSCHFEHSVSKIGRVLNSPNLSKNKIKAFTLAEVLITLAIIGVVAALTIPTLVTSYQKKMYVTQMKKNYNNLSNGFRTIMANDGVSKLTDTTLWSKFPSRSSGGGHDGYIHSTNINEEINKPFFDEFKKTFKVSSAYDYGKLPEQNNTLAKFLNGKDDTTINFGIFLTDGSWLHFNFRGKPDTIKCNGSSDCASLSEFQETHNTKTKFWQDVGYIEFDINGAKGPNIIGRDSFMFYLGNDGTLYPEGGVDYAVYHGCSQDDLINCRYYWKNENGYKACNLNSEGWGCAARIMEENWQMKY